MDEYTDEQPVDDYGAQDEQPPAYDEQPVDEYQDAPADEPPAYNEPPPADDYKDPEPEPEPEPEPQQSYDSGSSETRSDLDADAAWKEICEEQPSINWYLCEINKKANVVGVIAGNGGLGQLNGVLAGSAAKVYMGLLRVNSLDRGGSSRMKFIYVRFVGSGVGVMTKARLTPNLGKIGEMFPVKHLTQDVSEENCVDGGSFNVSTLSKEFLRVGGAHKPDSYVYGPGQSFDVK